MKKYYEENNTELVYTCSFSVVRKTIYDNNLSIDINRIRTIQVVLSDLWLKERRLCLNNFSSSTI